MLSKREPEKGREGVEPEPVAVYMPDPGGASEAYNKSLENKKTSTKKIVAELKRITTKS